MHSKLVKYALEALAGFGWVAVGVALVVGSYAQPAKIVVDPVAGVFRSVESLQCPDKWKTTTGTDPDSHAATKTCENDRYTITARDDGSPVGLDRQLRRMMTTQEINEVLK